MSAAEVAILVRVRDEASAAFDKIKGRASGMGDTLRNVASTAAGFVIGEGLLKLPGLLTGAAQAAVEDEAAMARLRQAVENTGATWGTYSGFLEQVIKRGQDLAFSDDQTRSAMALLTAQTGSVEEATKRYGIAMDFARGANIDVVTASRLLGKVNEHNISVLGRYGIAVTKGTTETELFGLLQQKFGGQAQAFANSTAGQMARASDQMQELKESIGYGVLPVMVFLATTLNTKVIPAVASFVDFIKAFATNDGPAAMTAFAALPPPLQLLATWIIVAKEKGQEWIDVFRADVLPVLLAVAGWLDDKVVPSLQRFAGFLADHKQDVTAFAVGAVMGVLVPAFIMWAVSAGAAALATIIAAAPVLALAAVIGLLGVAIFEGIKHQDAIKAKVLEVWGAIAAFVDEKLGFLVLVVMFYFEMIKNQVETAVKVVRDVIRIVMALIHGDWGEAWAGIRQLVTDIFDGVVKDLTLKFGFLRGVFGYAWAGIKNLMQELVFGIGQDIVNYIVKGIDSVADALWSKVKSMASKIADALNPKNWIGSPKGLQNWLPYYYEQGLQKLNSVVQRRASGAAAAASVVPHDMIAGAGGGLSVPLSPGRGGGAATPQQITNITQHIYIDRNEMHGDAATGFAAVAAQYA